MDKKHSILIIDDDLRYTANLKLGLNPAFHLISASNSKEALVALEQHAVETIILDYQLQLEDGLDILDQLRASGYNLPIIVVSGAIDLTMTTGFLKRRIFGFLEKPIILNELEDLLHQSVETFSRGSRGHITIFEINYDKRLVHYQKSTINLTPIEFQILAYFTKNPSRQIKRSQLTTHIWGETNISFNTLDTHLLNLKKKLPPFANGLTTIYGIGFYYEPQKS